MIKKVITYCKKGQLTMELFSLTDLKKKNLSDVFHFIYRNPGCSKQSIATTLSMSLPTVTQHLSTLTEKHLVEKCGQISSSVGRKAAAYAVIPTAKIALGVEILSHKIYIVALNLYGKKEAKEHLRLGFSQTEEYFEQVRSFVREFMDRHHIQDEQLLGIGFAIQGLPSRDGMEISYGKILNCHDVSIRVFSDGFKSPCRFFHDAECAAYSELWENSDVRDAIYISLSYHLGGAIIINGELQNGLTGKSGTFEHMTLIPGGLTCYCGQQGCAECYCSAWSLLDGDMELENFFEQKKQGDPVSLEKWEHYLKYLSMLINNLHLVIESTVILGGHITPYFSDEDMASIQNTLSGISTFHDPTDYIVLGRCRSDAVPIGAALHYIREFLDRIAYEGL